jgi:hypothetical protein
MLSDYSTIIILCCTLVLLIQTEYQNSQYHIFTDKEPFDNRFLYGGSFVKFNSDPNTHDFYGYGINAKYPNLVVPNSYVYANGKLIEYTPEDLPQ